MNFRGQTRLKILLAVLTVFALGCVTGAALDSAYRLQARGGHGERGREKDNFIEAMRRDLNLTNEQATQIRAIVDETRNEYRQLRGEVRPRYDALREKGRTRIRALLTPEQQQKFDAMAAARDARRGEDEKHKP
ncbi:MAG: hypothetical protein WCB68_07815 [Pyrinomonadaceae bacterium]